MFFQKTIGKSFGFNKTDYREKKYNYVADMLTSVKCEEEKYDYETIKNFSLIFEEIEKMG